MALNTYRRKRRFGRTPEPRGRKHKTGGNSFVVQKHAATRLHYDFRLELGGVLKSWAIPKGPSLDPADKRLAVHVEDHPLEYGDFEGVIPDEEYGGGSVMVWDQGTWVPDGDPEEGYRKGRLRFELKGKKLHGGWVLARMGGKPRAAGGEVGKENWLLIKSKDRSARPGEGDVLVRERVKSAASGRTMEQIERAQDRVWSSRGGEKAKAKAKGKPRRASSLASASASALASSVQELPGARKSSLPQHVNAQLATLVSDAPDGDEWLHEMKFDGYRILARIKEGEVHLYTRRGQDWTSRFEAIAAAAAALPARAAWLDGEVVVLEPDGTTSFQALQNALSRRREQDLVYFVFDLLYLDGFDLRPAPLETRKAALQALLVSDGKPDGALRFSDHVEGHGREFYERARRARLEGIISKRRDRPYQGRRTRDWLKVKCVQSQEFVIGGYTEPAGGRTAFGALLLGVYDDGRLIHVGKVGTGFTEQSLRELHARLRKLEREEPPFADPPRGAAARGVHWVKPELVADVAFTEWTQGNILRHPSFQGLREDKPAREVVRERAQKDRSSTSARGASRKRRTARATTTPARSRRTSTRSRAQDTGSDVVAGVKLTSPDKVMYPEQSVTKRDLALYYEAVADLTVPHVRNRPLTLVRCPDGFQEECFFQKHAGESEPKEILRIRLREAKGARTYMAIDSLAGLVACVQFGALELHVWNSRTDKLEHPDQLVFDLDPGSGVAWEDIITAARRMRDRIAELGLNSFVKTTGGKGLHVVVPIARRTDWEEVKAFSRAVAESVAREAPERYTTQMAKQRRRGKIFLDYLRNSRGATAITPYSTRARAGAPVATPILWNELTADLRPDRFDVRSIPARIQRLKHDPWEDFDDAREAITARMRGKLGHG